MHRSFVLLLSIAFAASSAVLAEEAVRPHVILETNQGAIELELYPDKAPKSVENFLQYVRDGFYEGTIFHRVISGFMIQGGGFTADLQKKATREPIENEAGNGLRNEIFTLAMARTRDPHSATCQFYINVNNNRSLDHRGPSPDGWGYAVFGKAVGGRDVVDAIARMPTSSRGPMRDVPREAVVIEKAYVVGEKQQDG